MCPHRTTAIQVPEWLVAPFTPADTGEWEQVVARCGSGTFLHKRSFLDYHGTRFLDRSLVIRDAAGRVRGVIPAAQGPEDDKQLISHPGATFGGLLADPQITGEPYRNMVESIMRTWRELGYHHLTYKAVPPIYHAFPNEEDLYAIWRLGGRLSRCALSACINLGNRLEPSSRRRRTLSKALRAPCIIDSGTQLLPTLWPLFEAALRSRHNVKVVHTLAEIQDLARRCPENIEVLGARVNGDLVAGIVLFSSATIVHVQYSLASPAGANVGAMDALIDRSIRNAVERGARYLDLGISTNPSDDSLNEGLHTFKMEFGAGTAVYEQYELAL